MMRQDPSPWLELGLCMIMTERPGFGASTRHAEHTFLDHADDLAGILDELAIEQAPLIAYSGGAPYALAMAERHPDRVEAVTIVVGAAELNEDEASGLIGPNADSYRLASADDRRGMVDLLSPIRKSMLDDPPRSMGDVMRSAPSADREIMDEPGWREMIRRGVKEGLRPGVEGWVDEAMLLIQGWEELSFRSVGSSVTWWHGTLDRNSPLSAVRRLVGRLPNARLEVWPDAGHLTPYLHERQILEELLARCERS